MAASKWRSVPLFALLVISFTSTNCFARQATSADAGNDNMPPASQGLSGGIGGSWEGPWTWPWRVPVSRSGSLYCMPVEGCIDDGNCGIYLHFDDGHLGSTLHNYKQNGFSATENGMSSREDEIRKRPEDDRRRASRNSNNNNDDKNIDGNMMRNDANTAPASN